MAASSEQKMPMFDPKSSTLTMFSKSSLGDLIGTLTRN